MLANSRQNRKGQHIKVLTFSFIYKVLAESEGFEPPVPRRVQQISSLPRSTTPAALLVSQYLQLNDLRFAIQFKIAGQSSHNDCRSTNVIIQYSSI